MKIERVTESEGEKIAAGLTERVDLDGTYFLVPRQEHPTRSFITPAPEGAGDYRAIVGLDKGRGRITLLLNRDHAVIMFGVTTKPL